MVWRVILDVIVIALLGVGIFYAWRLERLLRGLDKNRHDMEKFVAVFSSAVTRAEKGIRELQDTAQDTGVDVDRQIARARTLKDELGYLVDAADKIAGRLTDLSSEALARRATQQQQVPASEPLAAPPPPPPPKVEAAAPPPAPPQPAPLVLEEMPGPPPLPPWAKRATEEQVINREKPPVRTPQPQQMQKAAMALHQVKASAEKTPSGPPLRSQAERDLQKALEKIS